MFLPSWYLLQHREIVCCPSPCKHIFKTKHCSWTKRQFIFPITVCSGGRTETWGLLWDRALTVPSHAHPPRERSPPPGCTPGSAHPESRGPGRSRSLKVKFFKVTILLSIPNENRQIPVSKVRYIILHWPLCSLMAMMTSQPLQPLPGPGVVGLETSINIKSWKHSGYPDRPIPSEGGTLEPVYAWQGGRRPHCCHLR